MLRTTGSIAALVLLAVAGWIVFDHFSRPSREPLDPFRREAARQVAEQVASKIGIDGTPRLVVMAPLAGDEGEDEVTWQLYHAIRDSGRYKFIDSGKLAGWLHDQEKTLDDLRADTQLLTAAVEALGAEGLMTGKITSFPAPRGTHTTDLTLQMQVYDKSGAQQLAEEYSASVKPSMFSITWWRAYIISQSAWTRLFGWLLAVLLMPLALVPAIKKILSKDSNIANLWLLIGLTAWSSLVAYIAIGLSMSGFGGVAFLVAALAGAFYNYVAASAVEYYLR